MPDLNCAGLSANMEDYLEAILELETQSQVARVRDVAARLKVHVSSVSNALRVLKTRELVNHESYGYITLTESGRIIAEGVRRRHEAIVDFLQRILLMPPEVAEEEACRMEHSLGADALERLKAFNEFMRGHPQVEADWAGHHREQFAQGDVCVPAVAEETLDETTLDQVAPGGRARIVRVCGRGPIRRRLLDMGLRPGAEITVERLAPLGDPIEVLVMEYHLSLRKTEAASIRVVPLESAKPAVRPRRGRGNRHE
jgi:DtxR family transcriptional regulator, Mn-dependent transcriptional regulator